MGGCCRKPAAPALNESHEADLVLDSVLQQNRATPPVVKGGPLNASRNLPPDVAPKRSSAAARRAAAAASARDRPRPETSGNRGPPRRGGPERQGDGPRRGADQPGPTRQHRGSRFPPSPALRPTAALRNGPRPPSATDGSLRAAAMQQAGGGALARRRVRRRVERGRRKAKGGGGGEPTREDLVQLAVRERRAARARREAEVHGVERDSIVTDADLDKVFALEREAVTTGGMDGELWENMVDTEELRLDRIKSKDGGPQVFKATGVVRDLDPRQAYYVQMNNTYRKEWDEYVIDLVEAGHVADTEMFYVSIKFPMGVTNRDYYFYRRGRKYANGDRIVFSRTGEHPDYPPNASFIRADVYYSATILRPSSRVPGATEFFYMWKDDIRGAMPKWLVTWATKSALPSYINSLKTVTDAYVKKGGTFPPPSPPASDDEDALADEAMRKGLAASMGGPSASSSATGSSDYEYSYEYYDPRTGQPQPPPASPTFTARTHWSNESSSSASASSSSAASSSRHSFSRSAPDTSLSSSRPMHESDTASSYGINTSRGYGASGSSSSDPYATASSSPASDSDASSAALTDYTSTSRNRTTTSRRSGESFSHSGASTTESASSGSTRHLPSESSSGGMRAHKSTSAWLSSSPRGAGPSSSPPGLFSDAHKSDGSSSSTSFKTTLPPPRKRGGQPLGASLFGESSSGSHDRLRRQKSAPAGRRSASGVVAKKYPELLKPPEDGGAASTSRAASAGRRPEASIFFGESESRESKRNSGQARGRGRRAAQASNLFGDDSTSS